MDAWMKKTSELIWQDAQHQKLFEIIDSLKTNPERSALDKLTDYVEQHFVLEEEYMAQLNFPGIDKHIQAHRNFEKKIEKMVVEQVIFDDKFASKLSDFLSLWLNNHILTIDKELEDFILKSDQK